jgi:aspartokinase-like uncharacterized kinase
MAPQVELISTEELPPVAAAYPPLSPRMRPGLCDVFVKIGGSILDDDASTGRLVPYITALSRERRILIMTGGGRAAKRIKANQRAFGTDFQKCWKGAVLTLEVNIRLLASYSDSFDVVSSLADIRETFDEGRIAVLAPVRALKSSLHLVPNWEETTDSIGLHFAHTVGAQRYVIVSDVHGIYDKPPIGKDCCELPIPRLRVEELERLPTSKLDCAFPENFRRYPLPTVIVNGKFPDRVAAALCGRATVGTEIVCPVADSVLSGEQLAQQLEIP